MAGLALCANLVKIEPRSVFDRAIGSNGPDQFAAQCHLPVRPQFIRNVVRQMPASFMQQLRSCHSLAPILAVHCRSNRSAASHFLGRTWSVALEASQASSLA